MAVEVTGKEGKLTFNRDDDDTGGETLSTQQPKPSEETEKRTATPTPTQQAAKSQKQ